MPAPAVPERRKYVKNCSADGDTGKGHPARTEILAGLNIFRIVILPKADGMIERIKEILNHTFKQTKVIDHLTMI